MSALFILVVVYLVLGAFVGFCAGLLGIGGGLILVPSLYYIFKYYTLSGPTEDIMMHMALATSMAIILPTALSSAFAQHKRKAIDWAGVRLMAPGLVMGSLAGVFLVAGLKGQTLQIIFSVGLACIRCLLLVQRSHVPCLFLGNHPDQDTDTELYRHGVEQCCIQLYPDFR
jgi:uncharacterized membrane protein YfcA